MYRIMCNIRYCTTNATSVLLFDFLCTCLFAFPCNTHFLSWQYIRSRGNNKHVQQVRLACNNITSRQPNNTVVPEQQHNIAG